MCFVVDCVIVWLVLHPAIIQLYVYGLIGCIFSFELIHDDRPILGVCFLIGSVYYLILAYKLIYDNIKIQSLNKTKNITPIASI